VSDGLITWRSALQEAGFEWEEILAEIAARREPPPVEHWELHCDNPDEY
jgi:hypothetical protein